MAPRFPPGEPPRKQRANHLKKGNYGNKQFKQRSLASSAPEFTGKDLSRFSRSGRDGEMASAGWVYGESSPDGRQGWRRLQNVFHQFLHRQWPFLRRQVS